MFWNVQFSIFVLTDSDDSGEATGAITKAEDAHVSGKRANGSNRKPTENDGDKHDDGKQHEDCDKSAWRKFTKHKWRHSFLNASSVFLIDYERHEQSDGSNENGTNDARIPKAIHENGNDGRDEWVTSRNLRTSGWMLLLIMMLFWCSSRHARWHLRWIRRRRGTRRNRKQSSRRDWHRNLGQGQSREITCQCYNNLSIC